MMALLSSCQIEKRHYVRGFFINKTACEFDSSKKAMDARNTLMIPKTSEIELLEKHEPVIVINRENTLASVSETGSNELCLQPFIKSQNEQFFNLEKRLASKQQENRKDYCSSNSVFNDELKKIHPLAILGVALLLMIGVMSLVGKILPVFSFLAGIFFLCFPLVAFILLLIARSKTIKNPDKWDGLGSINTLLLILPKFK